MHMKKTVLLLFAALLALVSCEKATAPQEERDAVYRLDRLRFDFTVEREGATKGVRSAWRLGDRIFLFFQGVDAAYLTIDYDGTAWSKPATLNLREGASMPSLEKIGKMTAVYLPYGNVTPTWDSDTETWTFAGADFYFLRCENADYYITDTENQISSLGSYLYMSNAEDYVQFFIPSEDASESVRVACNALIPAGIGGVSSDGTVSDRSGVEQGTWLTAYADEIEDEKGYYFSGKLALRPGVNYYFAMDMSGAYRHYYKARNYAISAHGAYQLPALEDWPAVTEETTVEVAANTWSAMNKGAATPWKVGTQCDWTTASAFESEDFIIPSDAEWDVLRDRFNASWALMSIAGTTGYVVADRKNPANYFFLPCAPYWSGTSIEGVRHYVDIASDGTRETRDAETSQRACVRLISSHRSGGINPPEDGGEL